jgi:hypothetical protein
MASYSMMKEKQIASKLDPKERERKVRNMVQLNKVRLCRTNDKRSE